MDFDIVSEVLAMADERLLERIMHLESQPASRGEQNLSRQVDSVIGHLQRLFNTRQGNAPIALDFGIPDITNTTGEGITELTGRIEQELQRAIQKYEPRLRDVRVHLLSEHDDILTIRFKLEAVLTAGLHTPVVLETIVNAGGKVNVTTGA
jgi:type VI secretion system protein